MLGRNSIRTTAAALAVTLVAVACGGSGELTAGAWTPEQLCSFVDDAAVNAAAGRDDAESETLEWANGDAGCMWPGPQHSLLNADRLFWIEQSTQEEPNRFRTENELGIAGADISWISEAAAGFDTNIVAHVGNQRLTIQPGFEYDSNGALTDLALETLNAWIALQSAE